MDFFGFLQHTITTLLLIFACLIWGIATIPSVFLVFWTYDSLVNSELIIKIIGISLSLGFAYILWGISTVSMIGSIGFIIRPKKIEKKVPLRSMTTIRWGLIAALTKFSHSWIELISPSWISNLYYRMMGCKIGKNVQINTANLNDAFMVEIKDGAVIGGGASINAHLVENGELILAPVIIGNKSVIGAHSMITPGCEIGEGSIVAAKAVLPKWSKIPPYEIWGGIPAKFIKKIK